MRSRVPDTTTPIACTLDGPSYTQRLDEIRTLLARALRASRRDGPALHLTFDAGARDQVEEMVRKEKSCCAFLDFRLTEVDGAVNLAITVPPGAVDGADDLFAPFVVAPAARACGCAPKPVARRRRVWTALGLGGGAALLCAAGCSLAVVLATLGVGSAWASNLGALQAWWAPALGVAFLTLAAAWLVRYRIGGSQRQLRALQAGTVLVLLGVVWGWAGTTGL
jgi:hypothetical protein